MSNVGDYEDLMEKCDPGRHAIGNISLSSIIYHSVMLLLIIALLLTGYASKMPLSFWFTFITIYIIGALMAVVIGLLHGFIDYFVCRDALMLRRIRELENRCTCKSEGQP